MVCAQSHGAARAPHEQESIKRHIAATDKQIDQLVYGLYGLTGAGSRPIILPIGKQLAECLGIRKPPATGGQKGNER